MCLTLRTHSAARSAEPFVWLARSRVVAGWSVDRAALRELTREAREVTPSERTRRLKDVFATDLRSAVETIRIPSLVVHGTADRLVTRKDARDLADRLPNSTYKEISGAGHMPYLSHPERFNALVGDFLEKTLESSEF